MFLGIGTASTVLGITYGNGIIFGFTFVKLNGDGLVTVFAFILSSSTGVLSPVSEVLNAVLLPLPAFLPSLYY